MAKFRIEAVAGYLYIAIVEADSPEDAAPALGELIRAGAAQPIVGPGITTVRVRRLGGESEQDPAR